MPHEEVREHLNDDPIAIGREATKGDSKAVWEGKQET
jgi:hypothetical protein